MSEARVFVYYSPHQVEYISGQFENLLRRSDLLIVEAASQSVNAYESDFNALCQGKFRPKAMQAKYPSKPEMIVLHGLLYKTKKRIVFEKSPVTKSDVEQLSQLDSAAVSTATRDVAQAVVLKRKALVKFAELNNLRDRDLADLASHIIGTSAESQVLVWRGIAHRRRFSAELSSRGVSHVPFVAPNCALGPLSSLAEKLANGEFVSDKEIASVLTETIGEP